MSAVWDRLIERSSQTGRPLDETVRHHVLEGLLRRLSRLPSAADFVLRGSMLTRACVAPRVRVADDVDFVATFPHDVEDTARRFALALTSAEIEDEVCIEVESFRARGIWLQTAFPGVRLSVRAGLGRAEQTLQIDVGFNDPLIPPAQRMDYPMLLGPPVPVWAVRPETAVAWKLHGLAEMGPHGWRPKDLYDLYLFGESVSLDRSALTAAIEAAFLSRGYAVADAIAVFTMPDWWSLKSARVKWTEYRRAQPTAEGADNLQAIVHRVHAGLKPALRALNERAG
jgi:Nucleotidyl transferase AbiEii toxin, Type IV TA system